MNARERDCWVAWSVFGPVGDSHASSRAAVPFASPPQLMPLPVAPGAGGVGRAAASAVRRSLNLRLSGALTWRCSRAYLPSTRLLQ